MVEPPRVVGSSLPSLECPASPGGARGVNDRKSFGSAIQESSPLAFLATEFRDDAALKSCQCPADSPVTCDGEVSTRSEGDSTRESSPPSSLLSPDGDEKAVGSQASRSWALSRTTSDLEEPGLSSQVTPTLVTVSSSVSPRLYRHLVFVYGTLKRGMPNHHVFTRIAREVAEMILHQKACCSASGQDGAHADSVHNSTADAPEGDSGPVVYLFDAVTVDAYPLFVDANQRYRPCLFDACGVGEKVRREVYAVTDEVLHALDTFERVPEHYYRRSIRLKVVQDSAPQGSPAEVTAHVYFNMHLQLLAQAFGKKLEADDSLTSCENNDERGGGHGAHHGERVAYIHNYDTSHARLYVPRFRAAESALKMKLPCATATEFSFAGGRAAEQGA
ncbi:AIG2 family protein [Besnoitia besnoiti]|uniref:Gamma-glutamylcyclotransferase family protein n=1 Tax=Besnoitia besnoiti TaxID=94643 RepID=A0A2A9MLN2_BESBE|nr:AIG2 family protein [Besnoitia besnoiti]PFH36372.1 AIG2 family protein [Besnoitia besnoiti]